MLPGLAECAGALRCRVPLDGWDRLHVVLDFAGNKRRSAPVAQTIAFKLKTPGMRHPLLRGRHDQIETMRHPHNTSRTASPASHPARASWPHP